MRGRLVDTMPWLLSAERKDGDVSFSLLKWGREGSFPKPYCPYSGSWVLKVAAAGKPSRSCHAQRKPEVSGCGISIGKRNFLCYTPAHSEPAIGGSLLPPGRVRCAAGGRALISLSQQPAGQARDRIAGTMVGERSRNPPVSLSRGAAIAPISQSCPS